MSEDSPAPDAPARTPFDNPYFLPLLLWVFAVWFGYDGWFNESIESVRFNRYGFGLLLVAALFFTADAVRSLPLIWTWILLAYAVGFTGMNGFGTEGSWYNDWDGSELFNAWIARGSFIGAAVGALQQLAPRLVALPLWLGLAWFGYDGWLAEGAEPSLFDRYGFVLLAPPTVVFSVTALVKVPVPWALSFLGQALALGYMGWLGAEGSWYREWGEAALFNRGVAIAALVLSAVTALRARRRAARSRRDSAPRP